MVLVLPTPSVCLVQMVIASSLAAAPSSEVTAPGRTNRNHFSALEIMIAQRAKTALLAAHRPVELENVQADLELASATFARRPGSLAAACDKTEHLPAKTDRLNTEKSTATPFCDNVEDIDAGIVPLCGLVGTIPEASPGGLSSPA